MEKKIFTMYGHGGRLGHVTKIIFIDLCLLFPSRIHIKMALTGKTISEKKRFEHNDHICMYVGPGQG